MTESNILPFNFHVKGFFVFCTQMGFWNESGLFPSDNHPYTLGDSRGASPGRFFAFAFRASKGGMMKPIALDEITEDRATGKVAAIYEDMRQVLRSTQVNLIYRTLAVHEQYFSAAWDALRPNASIAYFERCADNLRMRMAPPMPPDVPDVGEELEDNFDYRPEDIGAVDGVLDIYNDANPKNLILAAALKGALNGMKIGGVRPGAESDTDELPKGPPSSMRGESLVDPAAVDASLGALYEEIRETTGGLGSVWRALGHHPAFLERVWPFLKEEMAKAGYRITVTQAQGAAAAAAQEFPFAVDLSRERVAALGLSESEIDVIDQKLDRFIHLIPRTNTLVLLMKAALVGEGKVRRKPFEGE